MPKSILESRNWFLDRETSGSAASSPPTVSTCFSSRAGASFVLVVKETTTERLLQVTEYICATAASQVTESVVLTWMVWEITRGGSGQLSWLLYGCSGKPHMGGLDVIMVLAWMLWETVRKRAGCNYDTEMDDHLKDVRWRH